MGIETTRGEREEAVCEGQSVLGDLAVSSTCIESFERVVAGLGGTVAGRMLVRTAATQVASASLRSSPSSIQDLLNWDGFLAVVPGMMKAVA